MSLWGWMQRFCDGLLDIGLVYEQTKKLLMFLEWIVVIGLLEVGQKEKMLDLRKGRNPTL